MSKAPQVGELVIGKVKEVKDYGAYIEVEEYPGYEGFVHVSEVSLKWVRNIREHLKEGHKNVFKVIRVNPSALQIDLSIRRVSQREKVDKLLEVKKETKVKKVLKTLEEEKMARVAQIVSEAYPDPEDLYDVFEEMATGKQVTHFFPQLTEEEAKALRQAVEHEIKVKEHELKFDMVLRCEAPNGARWIRETASAVEQLAEHGEDVEIRTKGAPVYGVVIRAASRERAEELMNKVIEMSRELMRKHGGIAEVKQTAK